MATLSKIPPTGKWPEIANSLNQNFTHIAQEMQSREVTVKLPQFDTTEEVKNKVLNPYEGQLVLIGSAKPLHYYKWHAGQWTDTGMVFNDPTVNLNDYYTKEHIDQRIVVVETIEE